MRTASRRIALMCWLSVLSMATSSAIGGCTSPRLVFPDARVADSGIDGSAVGIDGGDAPDAGLPPPDEDGAIEVDDGGADLDAGPDCDDGIACTIDVGTPTGACAHRASHARCAEGEACDVDLDCVAAAACADDATCADDDPCTTERCDRARAICAHAQLDGDADGDPPIVCGGTDCDDSDRDVHPLATESCNEVDDDCDDLVDEDIDLTTREQCGVCGVACTDTENCTDTECMPCGALGQACCEASTECPSGRCGEEGICRPICGEAYERCCAEGDLCSATNICTGGFCAPRSGCSSTECDLVRGGCPEGETCSFEAPSTGAPPDYVCRTYVEPGRGEPWDGTCTAHSDCPPLMQCEDEICQPVCCELPPSDTTFNGCASGLSCSLAGPSGPVGGCAPICDPIADLGCARGETCRPFDQGATCMTDGRPGTDGEACATGNDCDPGHACVVDGGGASSSCRVVCLIADPVCPGSTACTPDVTGRPRTFGVCR
jgi:hypothetical protein